MFRLAWDTSNFNALIELTASVVDCFHRVIASFNPSCSCLMRLFFVLFFAFFLLLEPFCLPSSSAIFYSLNLSMFENLHIVSDSRQALSLKYVAPACVCSLVP